MTNPNNVLGTPNALGGRTSPQGFSSGANGAFSTGITSGFRVRQNSPLGMSVLAGGESGIADQAILKDGNGDTYPVLNNSQAPISVTITSSNASNPRIDSVVIYRDMVATSSRDNYDNPELVGVIAVAGSPGSTPSAPNDAQIRAAITADGATGASAAYIVIANVRVNAGSTTIAGTAVTQTGVSSAIKARNIDFTTHTTAEQAIGTWIDGKTLYRRSGSITGITLAISTRQKFDLGFMADNIINSSVSVPGNTGYPQFNGGSWRNASGGLNAYCDVLKDADSYGGRVTLSYWNAATNTSNGKIVWSIEYTKP